MKATDDNKRPKNHKQVKNRRKDDRRAKGEATSCSELQY
jgi:hypothetical protein